MNYEERLQKVLVLGAAGKMGSGILLLTTLEMIDLQLKPENRGKEYVIYALDVSQSALTGLMKYLQVQIIKAAEKKINQLRAFYADREDLVDNAEIIDEYTKDAMHIVRPVTTLESAYEVNIIFEAASENPDLKVKLFSQINENSKVTPWFFTNTSSIPIGYLDKKAGLDGRILGVHFYNPPAVQKLVEVIRAENSKPELSEFVTQFIRNMRKVEVPSFDVAGFIGNGHFMRDALFGISLLDRLMPEASFAEAVYMVNKVSQDFMIRPMGIFQLIDYVGVDVCQFIMKVMNPYMEKEDIHSPLLDRMMEAGVKGGQNFDGSQKDGFLKYEKGRPSAIWDLDKGAYVSISDFAAGCDEKLGPLPAGHAPWRVVVGDRGKDEMLRKYFTAMQEMKTPGALLAIDYLRRSREIGENLVSGKVAHTPADVNTVLLTGFFHAYGPINDYIN
ncbi:MAG: 3-hydroxyacyl-CoA dehydrogenase family protein [Bacteroidales bacterium]